MQLYLPILRAEKASGDASWVGLHLRTWRTDVINAATLSLIVLPPYALAYHMLAVHAHGVFELIGAHSLARLWPARVFAPHIPDSAVAFFAAAWWFVQTVATHLLGVALPEETFYRGYLQPQLEHVMPPQARILGVPLGRAAIVSAALFALGHFLGEWNPLRFGPFFPALLFAWLRNATGSVVGAVVFHATCNVFGAVLYMLYQ
jgi:membrane protease YdiL (CAAX protease family)